MDRRDKKLALIEERRQQFAPILAARQAEREKKAAEQAAARKQQELELQKALEKSKAAAAALKAAKDREERQRRALLLHYQIYNEKQQNLQQSRHIERVEARTAQLLELARQKEEQEQKAKAAAELEDKKRKAESHPLRRVLSQLALRSWKALDLDSQLQILSSFENIQDFELKVRSSLAESEKTKEQPPIEAGTLLASSVPSPLK